MPRKGKSYRQLESQTPHLPMPFRAGDQGEAALGIGR